MFSVSMPNAETFSALVETATKCFATAASSPSLLDEPLARRRRVGERLEGAEGLGGDDEERLVGLEVAKRLDQVGRVDVRDEAEGEVATRVVAQRFVGHDGPEVGAADADVDDVLDRLAGVALPLTGAHATGEGTHLVQDLVDLGHDVDAVDDERRVLGHAQRDVQDRAVLGDVDVLAAEHRVAALGERRTRSRDR